MVEKKQKGLVFEVSLRGLLIGLLASLIALMGLFLFMAILTGRVSFADSPYPRQDRAILLLLSWIFIALPFLIIAPNKQGLTSSLAIFIGLYMSVAYVTGSVIVFSATGEMVMEMSLAMKMLITPIYFIVVLVVLLYNSVSGQEFFRSVIFGGVAIGFLVIGALVPGIL